VSSPATNTNATAPASIPAGSTPVIASLPSVTIRSTVILLSLHLRKFWKT
jgi:hypothetical protein